MQWSLYLLILMGQCCLFTCRLYEYHFIAENKSWYEAQRYCREKYTDLAKVFDMTDMSRLRNSAQNQGEAWIGLNNTGGNRTWHWSLPGVKYIHNDSSWNLEGRYGTEKSGNCGRKRYDNGDKKLADVSCDHTMWFICYDEKKKDSKTLNLIKTFMSWTQAQNYCRYNHTDLASGLNQVDGEEMKALFNGGPMSVWMGLFRDSWRWSDGSDSSFRYWDMQLFNDEQSNKTCAMTLLNRSGKWSSDECGKEKPFFCYDDKLILIQENKTWEEALDYCRIFHRGLVSITNPYQQRWAEVRAKNASSPFVWLGLRYSCTLDLWFWINDKVVCYEKWSREGKTEECDVAVGMQSGGQYEWVSQRDNETYNFVCFKYDF
ncbi:C-type mannose receptor 2-like isoform X1 [Simochromis diagramma]|uniref:C-type mannose receptor 2-like isoform X1 n=1 Tax=Simochromis diagramma TaxID=43689 RepID=UPI001A7EE68D|nr:C-type mannose receptor 2-like isoform X1 [Simochromis diagramma]XP_039897029.1 C-type mannose receptor 2-like isoform X1 [Simochromis diagramma]